MAFQLLPSHRGLCGVCIPRDRFPQNRYYHPPNRHIDRLVLEVNLILLLATMHQRFWRFASNTTKPIIQPHTYKRYCPVNRNDHQTLLTHYHKLKTNFYRILSLCVCVCVSTFFYGWTIYIGVCGSSQK